MRTASSIRQTVLIPHVIASVAAVPLLLTASCARPSPEPKLATTSSEPTRTPSPAPMPTQRGIEAGDINRSADPCSDFFEYANGTWRAQNPIPAGKPRWSRRVISHDVNRQKVRELVQELAAKTDWPAGSPEQLVSDHYASCMDEAGIEAAGISPVAPLLADLDAAKTPADVQRVIRRLHDLGIAAPFGETAAYDNFEPKDFLLNFVAGGLGLPDRDAYLKAEPGAVQLRDKYRQHVARVLALGGMPANATLAAADGVIALEKRLAEASLDAKTAADPAAIEHKMAFAELQKLAPHIEWDKYFDEARLPREPVNVTDPKFLQQVDKELKATPVAVWKAYLRWQLLDTASPALSRAFAEEAFAFKDRTLGGATEMKPRAQLCLESTETLLGEQVGRKYADRYFPPAAKAKAREITSGLLAVLKEDIAGLPWMTAEAKKMALEKLELTTVQLGYPDHWKDVSNVQIRRNTFWPNIAQARKFSVDDLRHQVAKPTDRNSWLLPPFFDVTATDATNYGAFGAGLTHDLTHAIDATGALVDAMGHMQNWWTDADQREFQKRGQCIVDQYEGYSIEPGVHHQGKLVLAEALGDQAGIHFAYLALKRSGRSAHRVSRAAEVDGDANGAGGGWFHARAAVLPRVGPVPGRDDADRDAAPDGQSRPPPRAEVPRARPAVQLAGVRTGVLLQGRRANGSTVRAALHRMVAPLARRPARDEDAGVGRRRDRDPGFRPLEGRRCALEWRCVG
jgi:endothelin-converting enzyme/putative endopeptidase